MILQKIHDKFGIDCVNRLVRYAEEIELWNEKFNLISRKNTRESIYELILDSAGLIEHIGGALTSDACDDESDEEVLIDLGSGAGFPGIVLSIMSGREIHLIERNQKKAKFLQHISEKFALRAKIHACDIRDAELPEAKVITIMAKAVSSCDKLAELCASKMQRYQKNSLLLLKGGRLNEEIEEMRCRWHFKLKSFANTYRNGSVIAKIEDVLKKKK